MAQQPVSDEVLIRVNEARKRKQLFASVLLSWEVACAALKKNELRRPNLLGLSVEDWAALVTSRYSLRWLPITHEIALEAAEVPAIYGSGDPGDCFLIATARVHSLTLVTRDERMLALTVSQPEYFRVLSC